MKHQSLNVVIKPAELSHIPGIKAICAQNMLSDVPPTEGELKKTGFLIYEPTEEELRNAILNKQAHIVLVATSGETVLAYAIARNISELDPTIRADVLASSKEVEQIVCREKVCFYIQVAKKAGVPHVGLDISKAMLKEMQQQGYTHLLCVIVHHPIANTKSIRFHEQFGFRCVGHIMMNNHTLGVYMNRL